MPELFLDPGGDVMGMFLRDDLSVRNRLHGSVVVVLVNLSINSLGGFFMSVRPDRLRSDSRLNNFIHLGGVASSAGNLLDCCFCGFHDGE